MPASNAEARAALQALLLSGKSNGQREFNEAVDREAREQAGIALRRQFKMDMKRALNPPKAAEETRIMEGHVSKLLDMAPNGDAIRFMQPPKHIADEVARRKKLHAANEESMQALPPWWILHGVTPEGPEIGHGSYQGISFSQQQQYEFGVDSEGKVLDRKKFDAKIAALTARKDEVPAGGANRFMPPPRHIADEVARRKKLHSKATMSIEVQTEARQNPPSEVAEPPIPEPPAPQPEGRKIWRCFDEENHAGVQVLRRQVKEARERLSKLDTETTRLTRELKKHRIENWEKQRVQCGLEREIDRILKTRAADIDPDAKQELDNRAEREAACLHELLVERQKSQQRLMQARHYDKMVQEQKHEMRDGDMLKMFQRELRHHPAGDVFLSAQMGGDDSDDDSDDGYGRYNRPSQPARQQVNSGSSDESDDEDHSRGRAPPSAPSQQYRTMNTESKRDADDDRSDASSMTSPSSQSGSGPSPSATNRLKVRLDDSDDLDRSNVLLVRMAGSIVRLGTTPKKVIRLS
jgi:hypothetical protein